MIEALKYLAQAFCLDSVNANAPERRFLGHFYQVGLA